jgi:hypothetical protein
MIGFTTKLHNADRLENTMTEVTYPAGKEGLIAVYDNYLDPAICQDLLNRIVHIYNELSYDGRTVAGVDIKTKCSRDSSLNRQYFIEHGQNWTYELQDIENEITATLSSLVAAYRSEYQALHDWMTIEDTGFQIQQYEKNMGYYRPHVDSLPGTEVGNRVLACIVYLNTVEEGGSTRFPLHNVQINPVQGRVALFPATWTHLHEGMPALSEDKWIISTFLNNSMSYNPPHTKFEDAFSHPHEDDHTH